MCCFSRAIDSVFDTNIFARFASSNRRQFLVYSMVMKASEDLAMILPIPVPAGSPDDAVKFINLEEYSQFFDDMRKGFPRSRNLKSEPATAVDSKKKPLEVVEVGSFEASFVPTTNDFARLDARFRLPDGTWDQLPQYKSYGFAVFKLKQGARKVHPMAFDFPTASPGKLFFPTVHIHDGQVHETADFDHSLYCQLEGVEARVALRWRESPQPAGMFLDKRRAGQLIDADAHVYERLIQGDFKNEDVWI